MGNPTRWSQVTDDLPRYEYVEDMVKHCLIAAVWADLPEEIETDLDSSELSSWSARSIAEVWRACSEFARDNWSDLEGMEASQAGHDYWLTSRGHGVGFWDRGLGEQGERLTEACKGSALEHVGVYCCPADGVFELD